MKNTGHPPYSPNGPANRFQTTRWTLILTAQGGDRDEARDALAALCAAYWFPLYAFVRRKGQDPGAAEDIVQGFFARLLERRDLDSIDRARGKFRSFLMAACAQLPGQSGRPRPREASAGAGGRRSRSTRSTPRAGTGGSRPTT